MTARVADRGTHAALLDSQRRVLERIANGAPLREILEMLVRLLEEQADGMRCAVLLADSAQQRLSFAAAPSIPEDYKTGIEPFLRIAPNMGSCGTAAFLRKPVYTQDTETDPRWKDCRDIAVRNGLRAIWSTPILSDDGAVLGTFAMYYEEPRVPSSEHVQLIDMATQMARVAIEAKASEELLHTVFECAPEGIEITDLEGNIIRVNPAFAHLIGHTQAELQGKTIADITHPDDCPHNKVLIDELLVGKRQQFAIDERYRRKDGEIIWVHNTVALLRGPAEEPRYVVALIEDITERKRAEAASLRLAKEIQALSRQKEDHLRLVIDTIPTMAWSVLPDGTVDFVNQRWLEYTGLSFGQALAAGTSIVHPEDLPSVLQKWSMDIAAGEPCEYEMRLRRADGEYRWFLIRTVPLRDKQGNIIKWYGTSVDIEDRKRAEDALRQSELDLAEAQRVARLGSWNFDATTNTVRWSAELYRIFDVERKTFDRSYAAFLSRVHPGDRTRVAQVNAEAAASGKPFAVEYRIQTSIGQLKHIREIGYARRGADGAVSGLFGTAQDVTDREQAEDALRASAVQLQALSRRLVKLQESERKNLARELHDRIGQNLTALNINLNILKNTLSSQVSKELRGRLADSAALLESTAAAIGNVVSELHPPMLDDHGLVLALDWYTRQFSARTGIAVTMRGLGSDQRFAPKAELALFRIAQEALNNVVKHARASRVDIALKRSGAEVVMSMQDDGVGFDTVEERAVGQHGLGIVTMRERAVAVGGRFEVQTLPGSGTRLTVRVPL